ncbi:MAG: 4Fe-4S dicluster domain-containing protein [Anaerovoracaceae bacterium]|nr:4Fe-4S dicluster domain-containing protein [Anaerovoracaceae bacterium]
MMIVEKKCISCGACVIVCPFRAIKLNGGRAVIDGNICTGCGKCVSKCIARAITDDGGGDLSSEDRGRDDKEIKYGGRRPE